MIKIENVEIFGWQAASAIKADNRRTEK